MTQLIVTLLLIAAECVIIVLAVRGIMRLRRQRPAIERAERLANEQVASMNETVDRTCRIMDAAAGKAPLDQRDIDWYHAQKVKEYEAKIAAYWPKGDSSTTKSEA